MKGKKGKIGYCVAALIVAAAVVIAWNPDVPVSRIYAYQAASEVAMEWHID